MSLLTNLAGATALGLTAPDPARVCSAVTLPTTTLVLFDDRLVALSLPNVSSGSSTRVDAAALLSGRYERSGSYELRGHPGLSWAADGGATVSASGLVSTALGGEVSARLDQLRVSSVVTSPVGVTSLALAADISNCPAAVAGWPIGATVKLTAVEGGLVQPAPTVDAVWSEDPSIVDFPVSTLLQGLALRAGTTLVHARHAGFEASLPVTVVATAPSALAVSGPSSRSIGTSFGYVADATLTSGNCNVSQGSSWESLAAGDRLWLATGGRAITTRMPAQAGPANLRATLGALSATTTVNVSGICRHRVEVSPPGVISLSLGRWADRRMSTVYSDGSATGGEPASLSTTPNLVAQSIPPDVIRVGGLAPLQGALTVRGGVGCLGSPISTTVPVTVTAPVPVRLTVAPAPLTPNPLRNFDGTPSMPVPFKLTLLVSATLTDGSVTAVTSGLSWRSTADAVASVDGSGVVTARAPGRAVITATVGALSGAYEVVVNAATMVAPPVVTLTPGSAPRRISRVATAIASFRVGLSGGSFSYDVTDLCRWSTAAASIATVDAIGSVTGLAPGTTTVGCDFLIGTGSTPVTVTNEAVGAIVVRDGALATLGSLSPGQSGSLRAFARYSGGLEYEVTSEALWSSTNITVATVDATGRAQARASGVATIQAAAEGLVGGYQLTVP